MSNILDYLRWRGDISFQTLPVNEVDGLILAQLAMVRWENWLTPGEAVPLKELQTRLDVQPISEGFTGADDQKLMALATGCARYGDIVLSDFAHAFDEGAGMQFAAITLHLPDRALYVAYRGTDSTLVGWKEDCNMAYSRPVPAQEAALRYLSDIASRYSGPIHVGGHSKGGNLAMYASARAEDAVLGRILNVFNNDGPGLSDLVDAGNLYARLGDRLRSYVPQSSIVGMLLAHPERYEVIRSNSVSILQHNPYSWQVEGPRFVRAEGLAWDSVFFESVFRKWLSGLDEEQRGAVVETLFDILGATDARSFGHEFRARLLRNPMALLSAAQSLDPEARREAGKAVGELIDVMMHTKAEPKPDKKQ